MFLYSQWTKLPISTRHTIAAVFGIRKTGSTEVANNQVVKDGYAIGDIESRITVDELQKYLATEVTEMAILWLMLVDKTEGRSLPPIIPVVVETPIVQKPEQTIEQSNAKPEKIRVVKAAPVVVPPKKKGRPAKTK